MCGVESEEAAEEGEHGREAVTQKKAYFQKKRSEKTDEREKTLKAVDKVLGGKLLAPRVTRE